MKIQALDIRIGDRIVAYCNNKRQICTVKAIIDPTQNNVTLSVMTTGHHQSAAMRVVRFRSDALVDLAEKVIAKPEDCPS